ncbi:hypothetical protein Pla52nx_001314 [Stieleria varia]
MKQDKAEQVLRDAKVARTRDNGAIGYITREKLSDPLPPREQFYAVDTQTRLDLSIERDSYTINKMILRISPDFEKERNPRYFPEYIYLNCQGVTFHGDGTYSVRFGPRELKADPEAEVRGYPYR